MVSKIFIVLVLLQTVLFSQTLRVSLGGSYPFHLKGGTNEDPNIPSEYQDIKEAPSIAQFFSNGISPYIDLSYRFNISNSTYDFGFGISYEAISLSNTMENSKYILGNEFNNKIISPYLTLGNNINGNRYYFILGISFNNPSGKAVVPAGVYFEKPLNMEAGYKSSASFRIGGGVDFNILNYLALNVAAAIDLRMIVRDNVKFYSENELIFEAKPVGDINLSDNTIALISAIAFNLHL
jgi:hypothetical protein